MAKVQGDTALAEPVGTGESCRQHSCAGRDRLIFLPDERQCGSVDLAQEGDGPGPLLSDVSLIGVETIGLRSSRRQPGLLQELVDRLLPLHRVGNSWAKSL